MRILVAEDEVTIARALKVMLEKSKYSVDVVHTGTDALSYITTVSYNALVLDIMMPGMDGIQVLTTARLFDRFYRADASHSSAVSGTGIGLSIARATAEAHGGSITAEATPDSITFRIRL